MTSVREHQSLLDQSYLHCRQIVLQAKSNLGRAFWLLPEPQRRGMDALYAFAREADDLVDHDAPLEERTNDLHAYRDQLTRAILGDQGAGVFPALIDTLERYKFSSQPLFDLLDGCAMDLTPRRYATWDELREYCLRVASSVGLVCLKIWDCELHLQQQAAIDCGLALQLTNILRDVRADAALGRIYLPLEDLARFGVTEEDILSCRASAATEQLIRFEVARAKELYRSAADTFGGSNHEPALLPRWLPSATYYLIHGSRQNHEPQLQPLWMPWHRLYWLMHQTYFRLLQKIEREPNVVFSRRIGLSWPTKVWLATRATLGF